MGPGSFVSALPELPTNTATIHLLILRIQRGCVWNRYMIPTYESCLLN